ncbi:MAG: hypothetical protein Q7S10_00280 [bacterium]|nr:hypothetical protein [bacterium]
MVVKLLIIGLLALALVIFFLALHWIVKSKMPPTSAKEIKAAEEPIAPLQKAKPRWVQQWARETGQVRITNRRQRRKTKRTL